MAYLILLTSKNEQCKLNIALLYMRINHVNVFHHFSCIIHEVFLQYSGETNYTFMSVP